MTDDVQKTDGIVSVKQWRLPNVSGDLLKLQMAPDYIAGFTNLAKQISTIFDRTSLNISPVSEFFQSIGGLFANTAKAKRILDAGWFPYIGMPHDLIDQLDAAQINDAFDEFTRDQWQSVRSALEETVSRAKVDSEASLAFDEALKSYEIGLYRTVVRCLFPEIERVARKQIFNGSAQQKDGIASLKWLRTALMEDFPIGLSVDADLGFALVEKLVDHLYRRVGEKDEDIRRIELDPIPNRHASQHGLVCYSTRQNAFNMLSITAFMFDLIMRAHAYRGGQKA